jgi:hypothetical protein
MVIHIVSFYGEERERDGTPKPFHTYRITASDWQLPGSATAHIEPMSMGPVPAHGGPFFASSGGVAAAVERALQALRNDPSNKPLKEYTTGEHLENVGAIEVDPNTGQAVDGRIFIRESDREHWIAQAPKIRKKSSVMTAAGQALLAAARRLLPLPEQE